MKINGSGRESQVTSEVGERIVPPFAGKSLGSRSICGRQVHLSLVFVGVNTLCAELHFSHVAAVSAAAKKVQTFTFLQGA
jgi:hypothetical protein